MSGVWIASYVALWIVVLTLVIMLLILYRQLGELFLATPEGRSRDGIPVGHRAPTFTLEDQSGNLVVLPSSKPVLLVFGLPTCGPCRTLMPDLVTFATQNQERVAVYFVAGQDKEANQRFAQEYSVPFPLLTQSELHIAQRYKVRQSPFAFYIDESGIVRAKAIVNRLSQLQQLTFGDQTVLLESIMGGA